MHARSLTAVALVPLVAVATLIAPAAAEEDTALKRALTVIDEYKSPGLEAEISGIFPHPSEDGIYYALVNKNPAYRYGQNPKIDERYRGSLITVNREGDILRAVPLAEDAFGGLAMVGDYLYAALMNAAELIKVVPESGEVLQRIPLPSPAGGLAYDHDREVLIAQLYVGYPHLAVIDPVRGTVVENLWSEESAMGLAKVDGDWLCTWASGWDPGSFSELRVLDQTTGRVRARVVLDRIHSVLAPALGPAGEPAFMSLVTTDSSSGETVVRKYGYVGERRWALN